jgi:hypothetical protein
MKGAAILAQHAKEVAAYARLFSDRFPARLASGFFLSDSLRVQIQRTARGRAGE